jgi:hypothetical protein
LFGILSENGKEAHDTDRARAVTEDITPHSAAIAIGIHPFVLPSTEFHSGVPHAKASRAGRTSRLKALSGLPSAFNRIMTGTNSNYNLEPSSGDRVLSASTARRGFGGTPSPRAVLRAMIPG